MKKLFNVNQSNHHLNYYLCGGIAGGLASIPTTPLDVIKTKLNTQTCLNRECEKRTVCERMVKESRKLEVHTSNINSVNPPAQVVYTNSRIKYHNILDTTVTIFREEGLSGFFLGLRMRMAIQTISSAIAWGTYQVVKSNLGNFNIHQH